MPSTYPVPGQRRAAVLVVILGLHVGAFLLLSAARHSGLRTRIPGAGRRRRPAARRPRSGAIGCGGARTAATDARCGPAGRNRRLLPRIASPPRAGRPRSRHAGRGFRWRREELDARGQHRMRRAGHGHRLHRASPRIRARPARWAADRVDGAHARGLPAEVRGAGAATFAMLAPPSPMRRPAMLAEATANR